MKIVTKRDKEPFLTVSLQYFSKEVRQDKKTKKEKYYELYKKFAWKSEYRTTSFRRLINSAN